MNLVFFSRSPRQNKSKLILSACPLSGAWTERAGRRGRRQVRAAGAAERSGGPVDRLKIPVIRMAGGRKPVTHTHVIYFKYTFRSVVH